MALEYLQLIAKIAYIETRLALAMEVGERHV
ncbi:hypothetical protein ACVWXS_001848 [Lysinibacillus sp. TE18511]